MSLPGRFFLLITIALAAPAFSCEGDLVAAVAAAQSRAWIRTISLSPSLTTALTKAGSRGLDVRALTNPSEALGPWHKTVAAAPGTGHPYAVVDGAVFVSASNTAGASFLGACVQPKDRETWELAFHSSWDSASDPAMPKVVPKFTADIATYYGADLLSPGSGADREFRYYDVRARQFSLSLAELRTELTSGPLTILFGTGGGHWFDLNTDSSESTRYLSEAHVDYRVGGWNLEFGKFFTHIGLEAPRARDNWNFSRSFVYGYGLPFWHIGGRATYTTGEWSFLGAVYNSTRSASRDENDSQTFGYGVRWQNTGNSTSAALAGVFGDEGNGPMERFTSTQDFNLLIDLGSGYAVGFDSELTMAEKPKLGIAHCSGELLARFPITQRYWIAPRIELFHDRIGESFGVADTTVLGGTLTHGVALTEAVELRLEARWDKASRPIFVGGAGSQTEQATLTVAALARL